MPLDVLRIGPPGLAVAFGPRPRPRLDPVAVAVGQEPVHAPNALGEEVRQFDSLGASQAVPVRHRREKSTRRASGPSLI